MPLRPCLEPGCPEFATWRGRCEEHNRKRERSINRVGRKVYATKRWRILREKKLRLNARDQKDGGNGGYCERCDARQAEHVHHKHGVALDPWAIEGLEALCVPCHSKETRQEQMA